MLEFTKNLPSVSHWPAGQVELEFRLKDSQIAVYVWYGAARREAQAADHADKVLATIEANMVAIAKKVGMREKEIRELSEVNAVRRLMAKENAADVLLRLNPISRDAIYKAVEVEHAKLLRSPASVV